MGPSISKRSTKDEKASLGSILFSEPWRWDHHDWNQLTFFPDGTGRVSLFLFVAELHFPPRGSAEKLIVAHLDDATH